MCLFHMNSSILRTGRRGQKFQIFYFQWRLLSQISDPYFQCLKELGGLPWLLESVKNPPAMQEIPVQWKIPWRRAWQPTPVFLPGESPRTEEPGRLQSTGLQSHTRLSNQVPLICLQICLPNQAVTSSSTEQYLSPLAAPSVQHGNTQNRFRMMLVPKQWMKGKREEERKESKNWRN